MRKLLILGSLLAATSIPAAAMADVRCVNPQNNGTTGAVVGAVGGAAAGAALAGRHSRGEGAILGALGGAVLGDVIGSNQKRCPDGYYAYDDQTRQYYDNDGHPYQPPGAYGAGYAPPPPSAGYGYGPPPGGPQYGQPQGGGYGGQQGPQGYGGPPPGQGYGPPPGGGYGGGRPMSMRARADALEQRIHADVENGQLSHRAARAALADLRDIRVQDQQLHERDGGELNQADRAYLDGRLDRAYRNLHYEQQGGY